MTVTQAPTPGPLDSETVKLLVKGDLLRALETTCAFCEGDVLTFDGPGPLNECMVFGMSWMASRFAFIGRPDADGWMPWSGGENPVPGQTVEVKWRDGRVFIGPSDDVTFFDWRHMVLASGSDIIAFRLAPTAPVEASGSGDLASAIAFMDKAGAMLGRGEMPAPGTPYAVEWYHAHATVLAALRPQPSGETRGAVARIVDPETFASIAHYSRIERFDGLTPEQREPDVFKGYPSLKVSRDAAYAKADAILALIRPAPVASGGQHSSGEDINWKSEWEAVSSLRIKDRAAMAQAVSEIVLDLKVRGYVSHDGDPNWCKEATAWEKIVVRNLSTIPAQPEALSEDDIRRRLIQRIEQWDGETEYDAEDIASLADDILHEFNGAPVLSSSALGYVSADAEAALKAGINRVIYPAPSAHASFPLYASPVPAQEGGAK